MIYLGMGCFWGAERRLWRLPGVVATEVGYAGGLTPHPTYEQVCTGRTGHAEVVKVSYDPAQVSTRDVLRVFWEHHDPTQGDRQGNDIGTQYRSLVLTTTPEQAAVADETRETYGRELAAHGLGPITTVIEPLSDDGAYYPAEEYHQKYLRKHPDGYDCHASTGLALPEPADARILRP